MAQSILIECTGFNGASLNAEDSMHFVAIDPYCMQWSQWSEAKCTTTGTNTKILWDQGLVIYKQFYTELVEQNCMKLTKHNILN